MATPIRLRSLIGIARLAEPAARRQGAGLDEPTTFLPPPNATYFSYSGTGRLVASGPVDEIARRFEWSYADLPPADLRYSAQRRF